MTNKDEPAPYSLKGRPFRAAIYARKSIEENGVADEARSVTRQIEHAKAYDPIIGGLLSPKALVPPTLEER